MTKSFRLLVIITFIYTTLVSCAGSRPLSLPLVTVDQVPQKASELSDNQLESWNSLDVIKDTVPGMSVNKAYDEIIKEYDYLKIVSVIIFAIIFFWIAGLSMKSNPLKLDNLCNFLVK